MPTIHELAAALDAVEKAAPRVFLGHAGVRPSETASERRRHGVERPAEEKLAAEETPPPRNADPDALAHRIWSRAMRQQRDGETTVQAVSHYLQAPQGALDYDAYLAACAAAHRPSDSLLKGDDQVVEVGLVEAAQELREATTSLNAEVGALAATGREAALTALEGMAAGLRQARPDLSRAQAVAEALSTPEGSMAYSRYVAMRSVASARAARS